MLEKSILNKFSKNNILLLQELVVCTMLPKKVLSQLFVFGIMIHTTGSGKNNLPFSVPAAPTAVAAAVIDPATAPAKTIV